MFYVTYLYISLNQNFPFFYQAQKKTKWSSKNWKDYFYKGVDFVLQFKHKIQSSVYLSVQISMLDLLFWEENCEKKQHFT